MFCSFVKKILHIFEIQIPQFNPVCTIQLSAFRQCTRIISNYCMVFVVHLTCFLFSVQRNFLLISASRDRSTKSAESATNVETVSQSQVIASAAAVVVLSPRPLAQTIHPYQNSHRRFILLSALVLCSDSQLLYCCEAEHQIPSISNRESRKSQGEILGTSRYYYQISVHYQNKKCTQVNAKCKQMHVLENMFFRIVIINNRSQHKGMRKEESKEG